MTQIGNDVKDEPKPDAEESPQTKHALSELKRVVDCFREDLVCIFDQIRTAIGTNNCCAIMKDPNLDGALHMNRLDSADLDSSIYPSVPKGETDKITLECRPAREQLKPGLIAAFAESWQEKSKKE